jgi:predicted ATPase/class 3 adenylate cyclase/Tfp pilus assembly protein PilF
VHCRAIEENRPNRGALMNDALILVLTDVVDSTQLNEELGDAEMAALWRRHDQLARDLMRAWQGQEIARSDGFLVLFQSVPNALGFALAYRRALRIDVRLKARVGVHVGPGVLRENSDADKAQGAPGVEIDGLVLPTAARVMAAARGGQVLATSAVVQTLDDAGQSVVVRSHGHWRLKGLAEPLELFEIGDDDRPFEPPADSAKAYRVVRTVDEWVPARKIANNLPAERDAFIGRQEALQALANLLDGPARLVTVLGIGGIGKTRLAVRHAHAWLGDYPGGAWFCDLSSARGLDGIVYAVAQALNVPLGKTDPVHQIASALAGRGPCLLLLDTFEQVARHAEATLGVWLEQAPEAKFIVTSREVLGIAGEYTHVLAPLSDDEAAELFLGRVAAAAQRTLLMPRDQLAIGPLVRLLDGLPLAIELAAARSRVMSPRMLLDRMHERFTLLATRGGRLDRQVTLRATLDWSWDLLLPQEKAALAQLSVFEGGFSLEAVESVLGSVPTAPTVLPLDLLQSLVDKSFVRKVAEDRFDLLQTVQEYSAQHLRAEGRFEGSGPMAALEVEVRHAVYYGGLSESELTAPGNLELDNVAAACRRAVQRGDANTAARTLTLAWSVFELRGPFRFGLDLATLVSGMAGLPLSLTASVLLIKGRALRAIGKAADAGGCFAMALSGFRAVHDERGEAEALSKLGSLKTNAGKLDEAGTHLRDGLALARKISDKALECELLNALGTLHDATGAIDAALSHYELALSIARSLGSRRWEGGVLGNLGNVYYNEGRVDEASVAYHAALVIAIELQNRQWEANTLCNLGLLEHVRGHASAARETLRRSLQVARQIGYVRLEAFALCNLGMVESATGDPMLARQHFEEALSISESLGDYLLHGQALGYLGLLCSRQGAFEEARSHLQRGQALLEATDDQPSLAILYCNAAHSFATAGDLEAARERFEAAVEIARVLGDKVAFDVRTAIDEIRLVLEKCASAAPSEKR